MDPSSSTSQGGRTYGRMEEGSIGVPGEMARSRNVDFPSGGGRTETGDRESERGRT